LGVIWRCSFYGVASLCSFFGVVGCFSFGVAERFFLGVSGRFSFGVVGRFSLGVVERFSGVLGAGFEPPRVCLCSTVFATTFEGFRLSISFLIDAVFYGDFSFLTDAGFSGDFSLVGTTTAETTACTI